jgi:sugar O-acyltransferase (sialic acid O-acetyltransferase NeuD family)
VPDDVTYLRIESYSSNDDQVKLVRRAVADGERVREGQLLAELETSKAVMEVRATKDGFVFFLSREEDFLRVGQVLAAISSSASFQFEPENPPASAPAASTPRLSRSAALLASENDLGPEHFCGMALVTRADVMARLEGNASPPESPPVNAQRIILIGAGGHARVCIDVLRRMSTFEIAGIAASDREIGDRVLDVPVIARDTELDRLYSRGFRFAVNAIGSISNHPARSRLYSRLKECGFALPNLVHPSAVVEPSARLGEANQILANAVVGSSATIASNCIVNCAAIVCHDSFLHDNVHLAPGAILAGGVIVGPDTLIGMGVKINRNVRVGRRVVIHNGCIVNRDVRDDSVVKAYAW